MLTKPLILCLGNEIVADDRFGYEIAERLAGDCHVGEAAEVVFAARAGFELIPLLTDRPAALIVDTIRTGRDEPGTLRWHEMRAFAPTKNLTTSHQISLPTALEFARLYQIPVPAEIDVLTVEAADLETLQEKLTPRIAAALEPAQRMIRQWLTAKVVHHVALEN